MVSAAIKESAPAMMKAIAHEMQVSLSSLQPVNVVNQSLTAQEVRDIVCEIMGKPKLTILSDKDQTYLMERGWLYQGGNDWCDMRPPPDMPKKMGVIMDPRTNKELRTITQVLCSGSIGQKYLATEALILETNRNRQPLPPFEIFECTGNPPYHEKTYPINLQKWAVRDRQRNKIAGPFDRKEDAEVAFVKSQSEFDMKNKVPQSATPTTAVA